MILCTEKQSEILHKLAENTLLSEREKWTKVYILIEEIIKKLNLVLFDKYAINIILGKPRDLTSFIYSVYSNRIAYDSHEIANFLDENLEKHQIRLETLMLH